MIEASAIAREEIYDAILDDEAFEAFPHLLKKLAGARSVIIGWIYPDGEQLIFNTCGYFGPQEIELYVREEIGGRDPWSQHAIEHFRTGEAIRTSEGVPHAQFERSALYNEFIKPLGDDTYHSLAVAAQGQHGIGCIAVHNGRAAGVFSQESVERLDGFGSDLARLVAIRAKFARLRSQSQLTSSMFDTMPMGAIFLHPGGRFAQANRKGEEMLADGGALTLAGGIVHARGAQGRALERGIALACDPKGPISTTLRLESERSHSYAVTIVPMRVPDAGRGALLLVREIGQELRSVEGQLAPLFGLTSAEAAVACLIANGYSPAEAAEMRGVGRETVRSQLKAVMSKMGCHRQSELTAVVRSITPIG